MIDAAIASPATTVSSLFPYSKSHRTLVCILLLLLVPVHDASTGPGRLCGDRLNEAMIAICTPNGSTTACFKGAGSFIGVGKRLYLEKQKMTDDEADYTIDVKRRLFCFSFAILTQINTVCDTRTLR